MSKWVQCRDLLWSWQPSLTSRPWFAISGEMSTWEDTAWVKKSWNVPILGSQRFAKWSLICEFVHVRRLYPVLCLSALRIFNHYRRFWWKVVGLYRTSEISCARSVIEYWWHWSWVIYVLITWGTSSAFGFWWGKGSLLGLDDWSVSARERGATQASCSKTSWTMTDGNICFRLKTYNGWDVGVYCLK